MRILIADDHPVMRGGLKAMLEQNDDMEVVGEAGTGPETLREVELLRPDVLILDIRMPGMPATRVAEGALQACPGLALVILTMHEDAYYVTEMMAIGARAFVLKKSRSRNLLEAIRLAHEGVRYVDPVLAGEVIAPFKGQPSADETSSRLTLLTPREREVCGLWAMGYTSPQVADKLSISKRTVETHRQRIMKKLGIKDRVQLVRFAIDHGLVDFS